MAVNSVLAVKFLRAEVWFKIGFKIGLRKPDFKLAFVAIV